MGDYDIEKRLQRIEHDLESTWNHKGEPWCIVNPVDGRIEDEGLGKICLRYSNRDPLTVTEWFDGLSPDELDSIFMKPYIKYEDFELLAEENVKLKKIHGIWFRETAAGSGGAVQRETDMENVQNMDGMIVTHYHPHGRPLSMEDRETFLNNNVLEMRAFGKGLLYILRRR